MQADESTPPSFVGLEHLLADGRLDEVVSLGLLGALPELGGWRARFELDRKRAHEVRLTVSAIPTRGYAEHASRWLQTADLTLVDWIPTLRSAVAACLGEVLEQLERHLLEEPDGKAARAIAQLSRREHPSVTPAELVRFHRERLEREGAAMLRGIDVRAGGFSLLGEVEADARAEFCLARQLGDEYERAQLLGYVDVPSHIYPKRVYRVRRSQRIQVLENGRCSAELCMESGIKVPEADEFLMKIVWLRANEQQVLRVANHFPSSRLLL